GAAGSCASPMSSALSFSSSPSPPRLAGCTEVRHVAHSTPRRDHRALPQPLWSCLQTLPSRAALHARPGPEVARPASAGGLAAAVVARLAAFAEASASRVRKPRRSLGGDGTRRPVFQGQPSLSREASAYWITCFRSQ